MKILNEFFLTREDILSPMTIRRICRFIRRNVDNDANLAELGQKLNLNSKSSCNDIEMAYRVLKECMPYYTVITRKRSDNVSYNVAHPVRLVKVTTDNIYKAILETDIAYFVQTLLNDNENKGVKLDLNDYVMLDEKGKIIRNFTHLKSNYRPRFEIFDEIAFRRKNYQLKFLSLLQLTKFPIYTLIERTEMDESILAYVYTILDKGDSRTILLESHVPDTATYVFQIKTSHFLESITLIKSYFFSMKKYKRAFLLEENSIFTQENGFINRMKIIHDNNANWETKILNICTDNL